MTNGATTYSSTTCTLVLKTVVNCVMGSRVPGKFPTLNSIIGSGDVSTASTKDMSPADTAVTVVVVVLGTLLIVLAAVYIVKGIRNSPGKSTSHTVLPSPPAGAASHGHASPSNEFTSAGPAADKSATTV